MMIAHRKKFINTLTYKGIKMDIARIIQTGEIISSIDLTLMDNILIDSLKANSQFECPECALLLSPASYKITNQVAPYFTPANKLNHHHPDCLHNTKNVNFRVYQNTTYNTELEIPFRFPNGLNLREPGLNNAPQVGNVNPHGPRIQQGNYQASSLFAICKTFSLFPLARKAMPLAINDIAGNTYNSCFHQVKFNTPGQNHKILFGLSAWNSGRSTHNNIDIFLLAWDIISKSSKKINLHIDCSTWSELTKRSFKIEFDDANEKAKKGNHKGSKSKTWIFFIGTQDETDVNKFHINNRKLISIIYTTI